MRPAIEIVEGRGDMPMVRVRTDLAEADVYLHGGHVTHFKPAGGDDVLFVSDKAVFDGTSPIRGGIPICFPWFGGNGPSADASSHGFARTATWSLVDLAQKDGEATIHLRLKSDEATRRRWPVDFAFDYTIRVGRSLDSDAAVTTASPASFELALHSYFRVHDVASTKLNGFSGGRYIDQLDGNTTKDQPEEPAIVGEVDRIYQGHTSDVTINDGHRTITIAKTGSTSTVLWNPHIAKSQRTPDLGDDEWPGFLCVETAAIGDGRIDLPDGGTHKMTLSITAS
ncbi:MAG: D-hexose-6-phosphate mutarotase [Planctomycetota bacterium]